MLGLHSDLTAKWDTLIHPRGASMLSPHSGPLPELSSMIHQLRLANSPKTQKWRMSRAVKEVMQDTYYMVHIYFLRQTQNQLQRLGQSAVSGITGEWGAPSGFATCPENLPIFATGQECCFLFLFFAFFFGLLEFLDCCFLLPGMYETKKQISKIPKLNKCRELNTWVPRLLTHLSSLYFSESLCVLFMCNAQGF